MNEKIEHTIQRTRQYWYVDGFSEILTGSVFLLLGIINFLGGIIAPSMGTALFVGIGYPAVIIVATFAGRQWVKKLKGKITFPRTGYVKYIQIQRSSRWKRAATAFFVAFTVSVVSIVIARGLDPFWIVLGTGLIIAAFIGYLAVQIPLNRFYLLAIWTVAVGLGAAFLSVSEDFQMSLLLGGCGLGWLAGGIYALVQYLRETLPANQGLDEE
ncbi:MAG TPA: hypothetical protein VF338_07265 [Leptolinea sp.]